MRDHNYYVYFLTNSTHTVLYIGMTNHLERRLMEHQSGLIDGFSKRYKTTKLVYFEHSFSVESALIREKQLKGWSRNKKEALIATLNPAWRDLGESGKGDPSLRSG